VAEEKWSIVEMSHMRDSGKKSLGI